MITQKLSLPNLSYRKDNTVCYWIAPIKDKEYKPRTVNLTHLIGKEAELKDTVEELNGDYIQWKTGLKKSYSFGTINDCLQAFEIDKESPYQELAKRSRRVYQHQLRHLRTSIGKTNLSYITGRDLKRWFNQWSNNGEKKAQARSRMAVLRSVINYGTQCRVKDCAELLTVMKATSRDLAGSAKRDVFFTADQVIALRKAAHAKGRPMMALAYALVFETTARLYDVILELDWSHIDGNEVLVFTPTKTQRKTGLKVIFPLKLAPMVQEELAHYTRERTGPVIVMEGTDRRYSEVYLSKLFRAHADEAGIPKEYVARDLRSSGITEARMYGADIGDLSKVAGHSSTQMTSLVYDRAALAAAQRVANIRNDNRPQVQLEEAS